MKIFSLALILASMNLYACPNLASKYSCQDESGTWEMTITQTEENGVTTYHQVVDNQEGTFIADGVARPHTVDAEGQTIVGTLTTTCNDPNVTIQFLGDHQGSKIDYLESLVLNEGVLSINDVLKMNGEVANTTTYECKQIN